MKILIIRTFPNELNINSYNVQEIGLARALIREGHQCDIVLYTNGKERTETIAVDKKEITIYWMKGINFFKNLIWPSHIFKLIKNYDIIQSCEYDQIYNTYLYKKIKNKLVIYHGPYYSNFNTRYNIKCKVFDLLFLNKKYKNIPIISKSELATNFLQQKGFLNVKTIGVGLDIDMLEKANNNSNNKYLKFDKRKKNLLYIGKLEERRNIHFLIDVFNDLNKIYKNLNLILIGKGDKKYIDSIKKQTQDYDISSKVVFIEKVEQSELKQIYKKSDVFILPTNYEIFGMVLLEAMYFGIPTITTLNGGSSTIIKDGYNGFIANIKDQTEWTSKISKILDSTTKKRIIGENANNTIVNKFLWSKLAKEFTKVYKGVIKNEDNIQKRK